MTIKKRKKASRIRGSHTAGRGFKKKARGKGHRGGVGKAGTGKRADHKKNLKLHPFGKGIALRRKIVPKLKTINLQQIQDNFSSLEEKKTIIKGEANFKGYKILGNGELTHKLIITASAASKSALDKVKKAGGEIILKEKPAEKSIEKSAKKITENPAEKTSK